jgi:dolichol-phosphate mannosyltransferase
LSALVTGAGGFVGANLVRRLLREGRDVVAVVRQVSTAWRLADCAPAPRVLELDLRDAEQIEAAIAETKPSTIFNLAASGAYSWQDDLDPMIDVNVRATGALIRGFLKVGGQAFVQAGSSSEYGLKDHAPGEDEPLEPNSHYAVTKAAATHLCGLHAASDGLPAVVLRLYSAYGPWEEPGRLMPTLVARALEGHLPPLVGPETARDFVFIDDVCDAFLAAEEQAQAHPGVVCNIGTGRQTQLRELVEIAMREFDVTDQPDWGTMSQRAWDSATWVADPSRARETLGWASHTSLTEGLRATAEWLRTQPPEILSRYTR